MIRKTTQVNSHVEKARYLSYILNPAQRNVRNADYVDGNRASMENFIFKLSDSEMGQIPNARLTLADLDKQHKILQQSAINSGRRPLEAWPSELQEKKDLWSAKLTVHIEELEHVQAELAKINEVEEVVQSQPHHRKDWGSGTMRDGVLVEIGGFAVKPNPDGLLCIDDERCEFSTMPVWRFQAQIVTPIHRGEAFRLRQATKEAVESGRPRKEIVKAKTPVWNRETDEIEYPGYSEAVLKKLQIE